MGEGQGDVAFDVDVPGALGAVAPVRHRLRDHLVEAGADARSVRRAELVVSELVTNAVVHGAPPVRVSAQTTPTEVVIAVSDASPRTPEVLDPPPEAPRGRGVLLVDRVADEWGVTRRPVGGKVVWARIAFAAAQPHPSAPAGGPLPAGDWRVACARATVERSSARQSPHPRTIPR